MGKRALRGLTVVMALGLSLTAPPQVKPAAPGPAPQNTPPQALECL